MSTGSFVWWTQPDVAELFDLHHWADLKTLQERYAGVRTVVFNEVIGHAMDVGAKTAVAEYRYLDADYRNEHSRFYSTTFRRYPSVAHRLHFFREALDADDILDALRPSRFDQAGYLGYAVLRPVSSGPIGRTMLALDETTSKHVSCKAEDTVNLFGSKLDVVGAPFMTQESQLGVCIHVTAWVCAYYHHLAFKAPRHLPGDIAALAPTELGRLVPAIPMSVGQLTTMLENVDLPPLVYDLRDLEGDETIFTIACRYLNSAFPVVVAGGGHAFVLVGYRRMANPGQPHARIEFIRQDDQRGPYQVVESPLLDRSRPWQYLVIPLPRKVYVSGEKAEAVASERLNLALSESASPAAAALRKRIASGDVVFRTAVVPSNTFKQELATRDATPDLVAAYQWTQMSRWVWVVEAIDRTAWDNGDKPVEAEVLIDATDHAGDPRPIAWRMPGQLMVADPDRDEVSVRPLGEVPRLRSVCRVDTALVGNAET